MGTSPRPSLICVLRSASEALMLAFPVPAKSAITPACAFQARTDLEYDRNIAPPRSGLVRQLRLQRLRLPAPANAGSERHASCVCPFVPPRRIGIEATLPENGWS